MLGKSVPPLGGASIVPRVGLNSLAVVVVFSEGKIVTLARVVSGRAPVEPAGNVSFGPIRGTVTVTVAIPEVTVLVVSVTCW